MTDLARKLPHASRLGIESRGPHNGIFWTNPRTAKTDPSDKTTVIFDDDGSRYSKHLSAMDGVTIDGVPNRVSASSLRDVEREGQQRAEKLKAAQRAETDEIMAGIRRQEAERGAVVDAYFDKLCALPEAEGRMRLVAKIAAVHNERSMPIEQARKFLRGFRTDAQRATVVQSADDRKTREATIKRKVEIRSAMLARSVTLDDVEKRVEQTNLNYALGLVANNGMSIVAALTAIGIDPSSF